MVFIVKYSGLRSAVDVGRSELELELENEISGVTDTDIMFEVVL